MSLKESELFDSERTKRKGSRKQTPTRTIEKKLDDIDAKFAIEGTENEHFLAGGVSSLLRHTHKAPLRSNVKKHQKTKALTLSQMEDRIKGGKFRWINEQLYTVTGDVAKRSFRKDPSLFKTYHEGYRKQVEQWPENPLNIIIRELEHRRGLVIADLGCGEALLAERCKNCTVHSFDLMKSKPFVKVANISDLPLKDETVDVAVSCLSLMGTDWPLFVKEAHRILKPGGLFRVAEVKSRIEDMEDFKEVFTRFGFDVKSVNDSNQMFVLCAFVKRNVDSKKEGKKKSKKTMKFKSKSSNRLVFSDDEASSEEKEDDAESEKEETENDDEESDSDSWDDEDEDNEDVGIQWNKKKIKPGSKEKKIRSGEIMEMALALKPCLYKRR